MSWADNTTGGRTILEGILPIKLTLTDSCRPGDLIGYDAISSNAWERAIASSAKIYAAFIAGEVGVSGDTITCFRQAYVSGFTGGETGHLLWLNSSAGTYAAEAPGNYQQCVGIMVDDATALVRPDSIPLNAFACETTSTGLGSAALIRAELFNGIGASMFGALKLETKVDSTADTVPSIRSLYIYHQANADSTSGEDNVIVRLEDGGSVASNAYLELQCTSAAGPSYLFYIGQGTATATRTLGTCSTQSGWLKCYVGGSDRYIALYTTVA
jgi:hypothetical protein